MPRSRKTHCKHGHALTRDNVVWTIDKRRLPKVSHHRHCRRCRLEAQRRCQGYTGRGRWPQSTTMRVA